MRDFDDWNEIKKQITVRSNNIILKEGEVYWCKFGINVGDETRGKRFCFKRPVLILRKFTRDFFLGIPLTSKEKSGDWYYKIQKENQKNFLILNQTKLLDKKRLEKRIYQISERELNKIKRAYCLLILKNNKTR